MRRSSHSVFILLLQIFTQPIDTVVALVVSAPGIPVDSFVDSTLRRQAPTEIKRRVSLRLRSTNEQDLPEIAVLLASANVNADESQWNWKTSMEVLRNKASYRNLLSLRYDAIREGAKLAKRIPLEKNLSAEDRMRLLWAHDSFRRKVEKAATMAKEPHVWKDFVVCPQDADSLQHQMITALDATTGKVVGFCEVAMLALPSSQQGHGASVAVAPTVANLVTCRKHRRQGIASSLIRSAQTYVERQWSSDEIALYVESSNRAAIALYSKHGFLESAGTRHDASEVFMTKSIRVHASTHRETVGVLLRPGYSGHMNCKV